MRVLTLDAALRSCSAGFVVGTEVVFSASGPDSAELPGCADRALAAADRRLDAVAVTVGPGSFTGLRSALALAHGIGLALGIRVLGVTVGAALAHLTPANRALWTVIDSRRGRVFLEREGVVVSAGLDDLPTPVSAVAVAGDSAIAVTARLAARGHDVHLLDARGPAPLGIALAARRGDTRPAQPLYVDPPEARPGPPGRPAPS